MRSYWVPMILNAVGLIAHVENLKNPDTKICDIESKMNEIILTIIQTHSIIEADKFYSELRIMDWIFFQVCINEIKN